MEIICSEFKHSSVDLHISLEIYSVKEGEAVGAGSLPNWASSHFSSGKNIFCKMFATSAKSWSATPGDAILFLVWVYLACAYP